MKKFGSRTPAPRAARDDRGQRKADRRDDEAAPRRAPQRPRDSHADPYRPAQRPLRARTEGSPARGFTVTLDPDVARVFRGDASVNKALRLVIQLMEVTAPRPRTSGERGHARPPRKSGGYQGSAEARGFVRKPRFDEGED